MGNCHASVATCRYPTDAGAVPHLHWDWQLTDPSHRALGVSVTDYTFEDCQLALSGGQLRLPADSCLLEFARLTRALG